MPIQNWNDDNTVDDDGGTLGYIMTLVGTQWRHSGNNHVYAVVGGNWIGDLDRWGVVHVRADSNVVYIRTIKNWCGTLENGEPRFVSFDVPFEPGEHQEVLDAIEQCNTGEE